jgi:para-nitrobenzyl esterase
MLKGRFIAAAAVAVGALAVATSGLTQPPAGGRGPAAQAPVEAKGEKGPVIRTRSGPVSGRVENGVVTYLGIPFAAPPVGDNRWRSPKAPASWTQVRDANRAGPGCAQQEDCLYLNVYTPATAKPGAKLPVMVWIYGGAFTGGNSTGGFGAQHDGREFAKKDIITVTFNYRLGRYGWFAHPALTKEGETANFGNADQIHALKWVRDNIGAFGGDNKNVTIFGESAGAISVLTLMSSPPAQGLFHKAISESGFPRVVATPLKVAEDWGAQAAAKAGVTGDSPATARALRALPISAFPPSAGLTDPTRPYPTLDGKIIRWNVTEAFTAGRQAKIPLIIGGNSNEASLFRPQAAEWARVNDRRDQLVRVFNPGNDKSDLQLINDLVTVQRMTEPERNLARIHSKVAPTYRYYFSYVTPSRRATSLGAAHVEEIPYVFNVLPGSATPQDLATGQAMNAYWAAFAKYGNPGAAGGPAWPKYDASRDAVLEFSNEGPRVRDQFQKAQSDYVEAGLPK